MTFNGKVGDKIFIKCANPDNPDEYSVYRITITKEDYQGDGLNDIWLAETTGYEQE